MAVWRSEVVVMGPVERELREWPTSIFDQVTWMQRYMSLEAYRLCVCASHRLKRSPVRAEDMPDVLSEAIEAAEALEL